MVNLDFHNSDANKEIPEDLVVEINFCLQSGKFKITFLKMCIDVSCLCFRLEVKWAM